MGNRALQAADGPRSYSGMGPAKDGPALRKTSLHGKREQLRSELKELFPELGSGIIVEVPARSKTRLKRDRKNP